MESIYNGLKNLITQDLINQAAETIHENEAKTTSAVSAIIPSVLGALLKAGATPKVQSVLNEASRVDVLPSIEQLFHGKISPEQQKISDDLLHAMAGTEVNDFTTAVATHNDMPFVNAKKLLSILLPVIARFLGNRADAEGGASKLFRELETEKNDFMGLIPAGISSLLGLVKKEKSQPLENEEEKGSKNGWLKWVILIALLAALIFWWRSCNDKDNVVQQTTELADTIKNKTGELIDEVKERISTDIELPNGIKLNAYKGGIEDQLYQFIKSEEYKKLPEDSLKNTWFNFDNIEFKHGSSSELTEESYPQLNNIVEILKQYKNVKVKVGGYTDKTGNPEANMKISQERANTIKSILVKGGIPSKRISAEGYGEKFAVYAADAPDSQRALDRKIALRITK